MLGDEFSEARRKRIEVLRNLRHGDILRYGTDRNPSYFFVLGVWGEEIRGRVYLLSTPDDISKLPLDNTLENLAVLRKESLPPWE